MLARGLSHERLQSRGKLPVARALGRGREREHERLPLAAGCGGVGGGAAAEGGGGEGEEEEGGGRQEEEGGEDAEAAGGAARGARGRHAPGCVVAVRGLLCSLLPALVRRRHSAEPQAVVLRLVSHAGMPTAVQRPVNLRAEMPGSAGRCSRGASLRPELNEKAAGNKGE